MDTEHLLEVRRARSKPGYGLEKLRLGKTLLRLEDVLKLGVQDCVDELEFPNEDVFTRWG